MASSKEIAGVKISELEHGLVANFSDEALIITTGSEFDEGGNKVHKSVSLDLANAIESNPFFQLGAIKALKSLAVNTSDLHTDEKLEGYVQKQEGKGLSSNDLTDDLLAKLDRLDPTNPLINVAAFNNKEFVITSSAQVWLAEGGIDPSRLDQTTYKLVTQVQMDAWDAKQDALSGSQLSALNSGITSALVGDIIGMRTDKQDALTEDQMRILALDIDATDVDNWNAHIANGGIHVTQAQKTSWTNKLDDIRAGTGVVLTNIPGKRGYVIDFDTTGVVVSGGTINVPIGTILSFIGNTAPDGFLLCDGSSLSKTVYSDLFSIIGYTYGGSGNTFNLPNLTDGRYLMGSNSSGAYVDAVLPQHQHSNVHSHPVGNHTHPVSTNAQTLSHVHNGGTLQVSFDDLHVDEDETILVVNDPSGVPVYKKVALSSTTKTVDVTGATQATVPMVNAQSLTTMVASGNIGEHTGNTGNVITDGNVFTGGNTDVVPKSLQVRFFIKAKRSDSDVFVDNALDADSINPVQNKVVTYNLNDIRNAYLKRDGTNTITGSIASENRVPIRAASDNSYIGIQGATSINTGARILLSGNKFTDPCAFYLSTGSVDGLSEGYNLKGKQSDGLLTWSGTQIRLTSGNNPVNDNDLARKKYIDDLVNGVKGDYLKRDGSNTMTGALKFNKTDKFGNISNSVLDGGTVVFGGPSGTEGAQLILLGKNHSEGGIFKLASYDSSTASYKILQNVGSDLGLLQWTGHTIRTTNFDGVATRAKWADLAEYYLMDQNYPIGTLVQFGGKKEMTVASNSVNGVISEKPALLMNSQFEGKDNAQPIALIGRVKVRVRGKVKKFDKIGLDPNNPGVAIKVHGALAIGTVLKGKSSSGEGLVLVSLRPMV